MYDRTPASSSTNSAWAGAIPARMLSSGWKASSTRAARHQRDHVGRLDLEPLEDVLRPVSVIVARGLVGRLEPEDSHGDGQRQPHLLLRDGRHLPRLVGALDRAEGELDELEDRHDPDEPALGGATLEVDPRHGLAPRALGEFR